MSSQGLFSITHGEVFPWGHALSEAPRLTLGLILSSATKCVPEQNKSYEAIVETLNLSISPTLANPWPSHEHNWSQINTSEALSPTVSGPAALGGLGAGAV